MNKKLIHIAFLIITSLSFGQSNFTKLDIATGSASANPRNFAAYNGKLYFSATGPFASGIGNELYATDGTQTGTQLVSNINPSFSESSIPENFTIFNNELYFSATNTTTGKELYKTNGTLVTLVKDIGVTTHSGIQSTSYIELNGFLYFFAEDTAGTGFDLWRTNGTEIGTTKVADISSYGIANKLNFFKYNNELYFLAQNINDITVGIELYKYNSTSNLVSLVVDIFPSNGQTSSIGYSFFTLFDNKLFFVADGKLRFTNGSTTEIVSIGSTNILGYFKLQVFQNQLFFIGNSTNNGSHDIYKCTFNSNSNAYEINLVYNFVQTANLPFDNIANDGFNAFTELNNKLYFAAREATSPNSGIVFQIYETNGANASVVVPITYTGSPTARRVSFITALHDKLYYLSSGTNSTDQLWEANPATGSFTQLTNFTPQPNIPEQVSERPMVVFNNELYFEAQKSGEGTELWKFGSTILPSQCIAFTGKIVNNKVALQWIVSNQVNTRKFYVEKSTDAVQFNTIGIVQAAGNAAQTITYNFDDIVNSPAAYYRIKQEDTDGSFNFLCNTIQLINNTPYKQIQIFPNAANKLVNVSLNTALLQSTIKVINTSGKAMLTLKANSMQLQIQVAHWPNGIYYLQVEKDGFMFTNKIIVQH